MKRIIASIAFALVFLSAGLWAQTTNQVEKVNRYRALQSDTQAAISEASDEIIAEKPAVSVGLRILEVRSAAQMKELGGYLWNNNVRQMKELGSTIFFWDSNAAQLKELGTFGWTQNAGQIGELGCRMAINSNGGYGGCYGGG